MTLASVPSAAAALLALVLAATVSLRGGRGLANVSFSLLMLGLVVREASDALLPRVGGVQAATLSGLAELATLPLWVVFAIVFGVPDAWAQLRRWWWAVGVTTILSAGLVGVVAFQPVVRMQQATEGTLLLLAPVGRASIILCLLVSVFVLFQLESALRNASGSARRRIKYFMLSLFGLFGSNVFGLSEQLLYGQVLVKRIPVQSSLTLLSLCLMALAVARHRLLEIDVFVSRQAVYSFLAVGTVGGYLLALGLTGEILVYLGIPLSPLVTAVAVFVSAMALGAGLLSEHVRGRVKRAISTHFYRTQYDYRHEWTEFTARVSHAGRPDLLPERFLEKVTQTIGSSVAGLWLCGPDRRWRFAASVGSSLDFASLDPEALVGAMLSGASTRAGYGRWRTMRVIPLEAEGQVSGLLAIEPPRDSRLTFEDEELLTTFASQAAIVLLNARLSEELAQARALEAVHRVSTFVLHDLKNCVAMLSLVSQNIQKHGHNPEFQREAFSAIAESVRQMQTVIGRLANPGALEGTGRPILLNKLVEEMVAQARAHPLGAVDIRTDLDSAADTVAVTVEAMQTILSNLLLNAVEAIGDSGRIEVRTSREGPWVTLSVADTGCGMSDEFVRDHLFLPRRTTKATGLGVGLYQVRSLVDALGGRIRVESRPGLGTTFWVDLPAERNPGGRTWRHRSS